jgi:hypothetical protein
VAVDGSDAIESCEEDAENDSGDPDSVKVTDVQVQGSDATADVAFSGGNFDGSTLRVALVEEDDGWKLDETTEFVDFDREGLLKALEESFGEEEFSPKEAKLAECILGAFGARSDQGLEEVFLDGASGFAEVFGECEQR